MYHCRDILHLAMKVLSVRLTANGVRLGLQEVDALQLLQYASAQRPLPGTESWDLKIPSECESLHFSNQQFCQLVVSCRTCDFGNQSGIHHERYSLQGTPPMFQDATFELYGYLRLKIAP